MKRITVPRIILPLIALAVLWAAAPSILSKPDTFSGRYHFVPQATPTALTAVTASNAYIEGIWISNADTVSHTILLQDASTIPILPSVSIPAKTAVSIPIPWYYYAPGGFSIQDATGAGSYYYISWRPQ